MFLRSKQPKIKQTTGYLGAGEVLYPTTHDAFMSFLREELNTMQYGHYSYIGGRSLETMIKENGPRLKEIIELYEQSKTSVSK